MMRLRTWSRGIVAVLALTIGCSGDSTAPKQLTVQDYISAVELTAIGVGETPIPYDNPVVAVFHDGVPPDESQGPTMGLDSVDGGPVQGDTFTYNLGSYARNAVKTIDVWVAQGTGYWELTLPEPKGSYAYGVGMTVTFTMASSAPLKPFDLRAKATDTLGATGVTATKRLVTTSPDSLSLPADIISTLSWTGGSDLDLHVVDPFGHDLSFSAPSTPEGGRLAPDGNGNCDSSSVSHETATWPARTAPKGAYTVYVVLYHDCDDGAPAPFSVSVQQGGGSARHFAGTFTGTAITSAPDTMATFTVK